MFDPNTQVPFLIAESGSTKTEWRLCHREAVLHAFRSQGCNPRVQTPEAIYEQFREVFATHLQQVLPRAIYFYGAGLGDKQPKETIFEQLKRCFPTAEVQVEHDMLAAARSTLRPEGIVCILGTGSNSCYHRQAQVVEVKGGLGYIVGDEGSGADLGKHLLKAILQDDMPPHIVQKFEDHFQKTAQQMLTQVMLASKPNVMLASWAPLLHQWAGEAAVEQLIVDRFLAFLDTTVCRYEAYKRLTVDFVGSIAHHFAPQLSQACHQCQLRLGTIDKDPVHKLVQYHLFGLRE